MCLYHKEDLLPCGPTKNCQRCKAGLYTVQFINTLRRRSKQEINDHFKIVSKFYISIKTIASSRG